MMKKIVTIIILLVGLITSTSAQGITNTLGGNTANDKFIVENSDLEAGFVVTGEGNVGVGKTDPVQKLDINGTAQMTGFKLTISPLDGYVLTSDVNGVGTWQAIPTTTPINGGDDDGAWTISGNNIYSTYSGNVGIGTTNPLSKLSVGGDGYSYSTISGSTALSTGRGVYGSASYTGDATNYGGYFKAAGESGRGVFGEASGVYGRGVYGIASLAAYPVINYGGFFVAEGSSGRGVYGRANGSSGMGVNGSSSGLDGYGIYGTASGRSGRGVYGEASATSGGTSYGGYFIARNDGGIGVYGSAPATSNAKNYGGYFEAAGRDGRGVYGEATNSNNVTNYGGYFRANGKDGVGIKGVAEGSNGIGVHGFASDYGREEGSANYGGYFESQGDHGYGVFGFSDTFQRGYGVYGYAIGAYGRGVVGYSQNNNYGIGVYGYGRPGSGQSYAGYFEGEMAVTHQAFFDEGVNIQGNLTKGAGSFKIDHPIDPENKYLSHSFVESPDMMNIYNGNIVTDYNGYVSIELPEWFDALNKDFRYQLTVIGDFAQAIVSEEISNNHFSIKTDKPNVKVSWQVTGIRQDAYANANRILVEEMKGDKDRGKYLHPIVYNLPKTYGISYDERMEQEKVRMEEEHARMREKRKVEETKRTEKQARREEERVIIKTERNRVEKRGK